MSKRLGAATAAGVIGVLASGSAPLAFAGPEPLPTYYYAAGTRQSGQPSQTSADEWRAFLGQTHTPEPFTVQYPRDLAPLIGTTTLDDSVRDGVSAAIDLILAEDTGNGVTLVGVSQGAVVMYRTKRELIEHPEHGIGPNEITVVTFGDPVNPDGGLMSKFDRWHVGVPGFTPATHTPGEGAYVTFAIEYDVIADAPDDLNPVSWANALMGGTYDHATYSKNLIDRAGADTRVVSNTEEWYENAGDTQAVARYQHNLIKQTNLPLTRPIRDIGTSIADDEGDVRVNRAVDRLDNLLRPIVDAGYDGGEPGGARHVGTVKAHYQNAGAAAVSEPTSPAGKPAKPVRAALTNIGDAVKKLTSRVAPKAPAGP